MYKKVPPPGDPFPINVEPKEVMDECPSDAELWGVVDGRHNGRAGGAAGIRAEHIKGWLNGMEQGEKKEHDNVGAGDAWRTFVKLIHVFYKTGRIPQKMM